MKDSSKTKQQLIEELTILKDKISKLEKADSRQKSTQTEPADSEHKYRRLVENMPALICTFLPDSTLTYVNKAYCDFFDKRPDDLIGKKFLDFLPDQATRDHVRNLYMSLTPENPSMTYEHEVVASDGTGQYSSHRWTDRAFFNKNGQISYFQSIGQDITEHKRTLETMIENETGYRLLADNATDVIWVIGLDMQPSYISPSITRLLGYTVEEAVARTMQQVFTPSSFEKAMQIFAEEMEIERTGQGNPARSLLVELELIRKDGSTVPVEGNYLFLRDQTGKANSILAIIRDITKRKRVEEQLRQSEAMLRSVFKAAPVGLCIMKNRTYLSANNAWCEQFGYPESDLIGRTTRFLYENEEEYERVGRELYSNLSSRGSASVLTKIHRYDGVFRDVIFTAVPLQMEDTYLGEVIAIEDITDHKVAEKELRKSRRQLEDIIEFLPDATLVIDKEGKVIAWNRAIEYMTGVKKEDMLGKGNQEHALPFYGYRRDILVDLALQSDRDIEKEYTSIQRLGDVLLGEAFTPNLPGNLHLAGTASVLRDSSGEVIAAIECIRDNTERKRLEEQLSRAQKMEALGTLAGGVAHDLNNVLGVLVGYTELMKQDLPEDSASAKYAENILQSSIRATAIIQDLLTMARRGVAVSKVVNLNKLITDHLKTPEFENLQTCHPNVQITTELADDLFNIKGSPVHLTKTIMNLVSNAVESINGEGKVSIKTKNRYLDQPIHGYDTMQEGDYAVLTVTDTGSGISAKDIDKIFEPFYTKKVMGRSGTGLGLAVVWGTVKDHKGYIDVQSKENEGSTFTLYFPVTREEQAQAEKKVSYLAYKGKGESILIVDDVKEQRQLAMSMLERLGYQVRAVASGEGAIEYLKNEKADLVVLDMIMSPGIDGFETYRRIRKINPRQKVVIVSGFTETDSVRKLQEMGAGEFVHKPYMMEKIGLAIKKELDRI
ncbi:MAG: PAS domain S-box protein [Smithella sp.]